MFYLDINSSAMHKLISMLTETLHLKFLHSSLTVRIFNLESPVFFALSLLAVNRTRAMKKNNIQLTATPKTTGP